MNRIAVVQPTIETADQLLYAKPKLDHVQRTFGRAVAPNPIAVRNDQSPFVEMSRRRSAHRSMRDIDGARNVACPVGLRRSRIDKKNLVSSSKSLIQIPGIDFVLEFRFVIRSWSSIGISCQTTPAGPQPENKPDS